MCFYRVLACGSMLQCEPIERLWASFGSRHLFQSDSLPIWVITQSMVDLVQQSGRGDHELSERTSPADSSVTVRSLPMWEDGQRMNSTKTLTRRKFASEFFSSVRVWLADVDKIISVVDEYFQATVCEQ